MFFRQSDILRRMELVPCDRSVLKSICFVVETEQTSVVCDYEQYGAGKYKISVKNAILTL